MSLLTYEVVLASGGLKKVVYVTADSCWAALARVRDQHGWKKWKVESYKLVAAD